MGGGFNYGGNGDGGYGMNGMGGGGGNHGPQYGGGSYGDGEYGGGECLCGCNSSLNILTHTLRVFDSWDRQLFTVLCFILCVV